MAATVRGAIRELLEQTMVTIDALLAAIDKHAVLFFPSGTYRVSRPLLLKPDTVLIGLNPGTTQISLMDGSPAFAGTGAPVGIIVAPKGGRNIVRALAITTGEPLLFAGADFTHTDVRSALA